MEERPRPSQTEQVECSICHKEIPKSEAKSAEADEYVLYFCGIDCHREWQKQAPR